MQVSLRAVAQQRIKVGVGQFDLGEGIDKKLKELRVFRRKEGITMVI